MIGIKDIRQPCQKAQSSTGQAICAFAKWINALILRWIQW
ncbi:Uncharacterised protein [Vibrio cholerae]|nr:Uncharacterised protein [Vibrio cholerae]